MIALPAAPAEAQSFVESRIDVAADEFEYQLSDVDGDRRVDLFVTSADAGERTLRMWKQRADASFPTEPDFRLSVPPDVVSWALLDLREEPGRELVLLTRGGIFSLTTTRPGLQGNLRRELALPLFPDLPDPGQLACWRFVRDVDGDGRDDLIVMSEGSLVALGVAREGADAGKLHRLFAVDCGEEIAEDENATLTIADTGLHVRSRGGLQSLFPGARTSRSLFQEEKLFAQRRRYRVPALADWDGDGRLDCVRLSSRAASVRLRLPDGSFEASPQSIEYPSGAGEQDDEDVSRQPPRARAELDDLDGDGRAELVLFRDDGDGFGKQSVALVFPRGADGRPAPTPSARVKLPGMDVQWQFADVDHDGARDLLARVVNIPTGLTTIATIRLDFTFYVFSGRPGAQLSREPEVRFERHFKPEELTRVQESLLTKLDGDFDGDSVCDLVSTQLDGRVEIRKVAKKEGRFVLEEKPFSSFMPSALVERLETWDISDDAISDLILRHERGFTIFVSRRGSGR